MNFMVSIHYIAIIIIYCILKEPDFLSYKVHGTINEDMFTKLFT